MNVSSKVLLPRARMSAVGVSQASTLPACMSEIRSHRSASFMKCVEMKMVTLRSRDSLMSSSQN